MSYRVRRIPPRLRRSILATRTAGTLLSNAAYNLANGFSDTLSSYEKGHLKKLYRDWDEVVIELIKLTRE